MTDKRSSTGITALAAFNEDPEIRRLIGRLEVAFPGEGQSRACDLIVGNLSTSALTEKYGPDRPGGLEFFRADLRMLLGDDEA